MPICPMEGTTPASPLVDLEIPAQATRKARLVEAVSTCQSAIESSTRKQASIDGWDPWKERCQVCNGLSPGEMANSPFS